MLQAERVYEKIQHPGPGLINLLKSGRIPPKTRKPNICFWKRDRTNSIGRFNLPNLYQGHSAGDLPLGNKNAKTSPRHVSSFEIPRFRPRFQKWRFRFQIDKDANGPQILYQSRFPANSRQTRFGNGFREMRSRFP